MTKGDVAPAADTMAVFDPVCQTWREGLDVWLSSDCDPPGFGDEECWLAAIPASCPSA